MSDRILETTDEFFELFKSTLSEYTQVNMVNPRLDLVRDDRAAGLHHATASMESAGASSAHSRGIG
ncbi:MAG: hypothetical protein VB144_02230 [Clostridia bacterium]|nr:hypothetical protein [Clostridia bacterium]